MLRIQPLRAGSERGGDSYQLYGRKCETGVDLCEVTQAVEGLL